MRVVHRSGGSKTCESDDRISAGGIGSSFASPASSFANTTRTLGLPRSTGRLGEPPRLWTDAQHDPTGEALIHDDSDHRRGDLLRWRHHRRGHHPPPFPPPPGPPALDPRAIDPNPAD